MQTTRFTRRHLPHWEVANGRYFVTVRCADSLPAEAVERLAEQQRALSAIKACSPEFARLQRVVFRTMELYLDAGAGACPLQHPAAADAVVGELEALTEMRVSVPHFTIMPNHWHALLVSQEPWNVALNAVMRRLKGRTAKRIRRAGEVAGRFWQREWFDRWVRNEEEWMRCVEYIRQNPVRAGIVRSWHDHRWTR